MSFYDNAVDVHEHVIFFLHISQKEQMKQRRVLFRILDGHYNDEINLRLLLIDLCTYLR